MWRSASRVVPRSGPCAWRGATRHTSRTPYLLYSTSVPFPPEGTRLESFAGSEAESQEVRPNADKRIEQFASQINARLSGGADLTKVLQTVWSDPAVTAVCPDLAIRLTSLRGEISKAVWRARGHNPDEVQILAVGTVSIPQHLKGYHNFLHSFFESSARQVREIHQGSDFLIGYDLMSKGSEEARKSVLTLFNEHYGFDAQTLESCWKNAAIAAGGMRGLKDIADACVLAAKAKNSLHRFIQPDNSFGTWWNIIEKGSEGLSAPAHNSGSSKVQPQVLTSSRSEIIVLPTKPGNKLHLSPEDVHEFYDGIKGLSTIQPYSESWYITPVGNPSGTKMSGKQLEATLHAILERNPKAIIILDTVYARTLKREAALELFKRVVGDKKLLDNIVFLESFSKSHGLCGERLAIYWSANESLFTKLHTANIAYSAGPGRYKDYQCIAMGNQSKEDKNSIDELHNHWQQERKGLYRYLMNHAKSKDLFDSDQSHITDEDINQSLGLYLLMRVRPGVTAQTVLMETGALGVDSPFLSGPYIRFAVGGITKPTYARYA